MRLQAPTRIRQGQRQLVGPRSKNNRHVPSYADLTQGCRAHYEEFAGRKVFQGSRTVNIGSYPLPLTILNQFQKQGSDVLLNVWKQK